MARTTMKETVRTKGEENREEMGKEEGPRLYLSEVLVDYDDGLTFEGSLRVFAPSIVGSR